MTTLRSKKAGPHDPVQGALYLLTGPLLGLRVLAWGMADRGTLAGGWSRALLTQTGQFRLPAAGGHGLFSMVGPGALRLPEALVPGLAQHDTLVLALQAVVQVTGHRPAQRV